MNLLIYFSVLCVVVILPVYSMANVTEDGQAICDAAYSKGKSGDYAGTITECNRGIELFPKSPTLFLIRGMAEAHLNQLHQAIIDYTTTINLDPLNEQAYLYCAQAKEQLDDKTGALTNYTMMIKINPTNANAYYSRGNVKISLKETQGAIKDFSKAIELNPNHAWAYNNRGMQLNVLEDFKQAISDLNKAISIEPTNAVFYQNRGQIKRISEDYNGAVLDFKKAIEIDPQLLLAYGGLGMTYSSLFQLESALTNFHKALALQSGSLQAIGIEQRTYLLRMQIGETKEVVDEITHKLQNSAYDANKLKEIVFEVEPFLAGVISEDTFLQNATNSFWPPQLQRAQLCEACYYAGMKHLVSGDTNGAIHLFQKGVDAGKLRFDNVYFEEYHDAKAELQRLK